MTGAARFQSLRGGCGPRCLFMCCLYLPEGRWFVSVNQSMVLAYFYGLLAEHDA
ncbi:hypothetical protein Pat9b_4898 (plasmid) [Pantoea sp. At-9b]|nr:hypothetical protein Pat9b_4898 [Pantoea sp. At-9b]